VNKLVPATSLLWALYKSGVYDYDYDRHTPSKRDGEIQRQIDGQLDRERGKAS